MKINHWFKRKIRKYQSNRLARKRRQESQRYQMKVTDHWRSVQVNHPVKKRLTEVQQYISKTVNDRKQYIERVKQHNKKLSWWDKFSDREISVDTAKYDEAIIKLEKLKAKYESLEVELDSIIQTKVERSCQRIVSSLTAAEAILEVELDRSVNDKGLHK